MTVNHIPAAGRAMRPLLLGGLLLSCAAALVTASAFAHQPAEPAHQQYAEGELKPDNGSTIRDFSIS